MYTSKPILCISPTPLECTRSRSLDLLDLLDLAYVHNAHRVGESGTLLPAGHNNNGNASLQEATHFAKVQAVLDTRINVLQPIAERSICFECKTNVYIKYWKYQINLHTLVGQRQDSAEQVRLTSGLCETSDRNDRTLWLVLGDQMCRSATGRDHNNSGRVTLGRSFYRGDGNGMGSVQWGRRIGHQIAKQIALPQRCFGLLAHLGHGQHTLQRIVALGCLSGQHNTVSAVKHGVGDVRNFSASGTRLLHHRLQHLGGANDWLSFLFGNTDNW